jgi:hypothetical protein
MKHKVVIISICLLFILSILTIYPDYVGGQQQISIGEIFYVDKFGGNLKGKLNLTISNLESIDELPSSIRLIYPLQFGSHIKYLDAQWTSINLGVNTQIKEDKFIIIISLDNISSLENGEVTINLELFLPLYVKATEPFKFILEMPIYPNVENMNIEIVEYEVDLPLGVDATEYPEGFVKESVGPAGVDQYNLLKTYYSDEIEFTEGLPPNLTITLESRDGVGIYLFSGVINREIYLMPYGSYQVRDTILLENHLKHPVDTTRGLRFDKTPLINDLRFLSSIGVPLDSQIREFYAEARLPYSFLPGMNLSVVAIYNVALENAETKSLFPLTYDLILQNFLTSRYFIEKMYITVYSPNGDIVYNAMLTDVTEYSEVEIEVSVTTSIGQVLISIMGILYIPLIAGIGVTLYRLFAGPFALKMPPEIEEYSKTLSKEIDIMRGLIELEDSYLARKIKSKVYLEKRSRFIKRLRDVQVNVNNVERKLKNLKGDKRADTLLELRQKLEREWNQLKRLEKRFIDRKISPSDYVEERKKQLTNFKATIRKAEALFR